MNTNNNKKKQRLNLLKDKINEIIDQKFPFSKFNNNTSQTIIEENCSPEKFDRLSIIFESEKNINNNNNNNNNLYFNDEDSFKITKFWLIKEKLIIYEWKNFNYYNIQNQIIENLENQFEKSLLHKDDFQITKTIKFYQTNRCEPTIGYRPNNRIIINNSSNNNIYNNEENFHPSIVIDIGFYENLNDLLSKSKVFIGLTNIKIIVLLKFWFNEKDNTYKFLLIEIFKDSNYPLLKLKIERILISGNNNDIIDDKSIMKIVNNWVSEISNTIKIPNYEHYRDNDSNLIELPLSHLYYNVPDGEISKNQKNIKIDINQINQIIE
ncbi:hypothetical protein RB653_004245 [Dictyostelium firmibasis]|uniref:Uncharacterized protein n=1 Tax=Dictyostelium firmibasis TaxID=79012 RepID=A0AAN7UA76_9MYCE